MNKSIHLYYIIGILVGVLILVSAIKFGGNEKLVEYVLFALAVTSLILTLVTIIYSFISSASLSNSLGSLMNLSSNVEKSSKTIEQASNELSEKISIIPTQIESVAKKVEMLGGELKELYVRSKAEEKGKIKPEMLSDNIISNFVSTSSTYGLLILYAFSLSKEKDRPFNLDDLCKTAQMSIDYVFAYAVAVASFDVIDYTDDRKIIKINKMNASLLKLIEPEINRRIEKENKKHIDYLKNKKEMINKYFC
jgi:hypothetical protein